MDREKVAELTFNVAMVIFAIVSSLLILYGYTHADPETKDFIFWSVVTQPQE